LLVVPSAHVVSVHHTHVQLAHCLCYSILPHTHPTHTHVIPLFGCPSHPVGIRMVVPTCFPHTFTFTCYTHFTFTHYTLHSPHLPLVCGFPLRRCDLVVTFGLHLIYIPLHTHITAVVQLHIGFRCVLLLLRYIVTLYICSCCWSVDFHVLLHTLCCYLYHAFWLHILHTFCSCLHCPHTGLRLGYRFGHIAAGCW